MPCRELSRTVLVQASKPSSGSESNRDAQHRPITAGSMTPWTGQSLYDYWETGLPLLCNGQSNALPCQPPSSTQISCLTSSNGWPKSHAGGYLDSGTTAPSPALSINLDQQAGLSSRARLGFGWSIHYITALQS